MKKNSKKSTLINYIGNFAKIKEDVKINPNDNLVKTHNYPYKIINQKDNDWICLESNVFCTFASNTYTTYEVQDRSFWMKVNECEIIKK